MFKHLWIDPKAVKDLLMFHLQVIRSLTEQLKVYRLPFPIPPPLSRSFPWSNKGRQQQHCLLSPIPRYPQILTLGFGEGTGGNRGNAGCSKPWSGFTLEGDALGLYASGFKKALLEECGKVAPPEPGATPFSSSCQCFPSTSRYFRLF